MLWVVLSLLTAFFSASEAAWLKRFFSHKKPLEMAAVPLVYSMPWFLVMLVLLPASPLKEGFWWTLAVLLPVNGMGFLFHMSAVNVSAISLTMPLLAFTPAFVILTGWLILDETLSLGGILGIGLIVCGSYLLNLQTGKNRGFLRPIKTLLRDRGARYMLMAAATYSFAAVLGKQLILQSSPLYGGIIFFCLLNPFLLLILILSRRIQMRNFADSPLRGMFVGLIFFIHIICHFSAIALIKAAYMIAIKRLNGLFSVLYGWLVFKEENIPFRFSGAVLMFLGTVLLVVMG